MIGITAYKLAVITFKVQRIAPRISPRSDGPAFPSREEVMSEKTNVLRFHHFIHPFQNRKKGGNK